MTGHHPPTALTPALVALVVDVDGVVSAVHPERDAWGDEVTAGNMFGPVRVSPALCRRLDALAKLPHVVPLWLTSWPRESRQGMDPFPGGNWESLSAPQHTEGTEELVAADGAETTGVPGASAAVAEPDRLDWWKWTALRAWLLTHRHIRSVVWCDDDLAQPLWAEEFAQTDDDLAEGGPLAPAFAVEDEDAQFLTTAGQVIAPRLAQLGVTATLIAPETALGLTREDLDHVEAALSAVQRR